MLDIALAASGGIALALGLASRPLRNLPLSEPLAALVVGVVLGPAVAGVLDIPAAMEAQTLEIAAELVVALSLMAVALRFPPADVLREWPALVLLLTVVLVGMAAASTGLAALLGVPLAGAPLLGAIIAPTDPVLASSIVAGEPARRTLPERLRLLISVESAANDGLAFALVLLGVSTVLGIALGGALTDAAFQFIIAVVLGAALGWASGRLVVFADQHHDIEHSAFIALTLSLTVFVLGVVNIAGGQGILGVFVAGLTYSHELTRSERRDE